MKTLYPTGLALTIAAGMALPLAGSAQAAMGGALPTTQILPVENAQFFFLGHNFCWYDDGWQGPGWYWCNYAWNNGYGWGGGEGWHGWNHGQRGVYRGPNGLAPRSPVGHAPLVNGGHTPQYHAPQNNVVRTPQYHGGAAPHGAGPNHGGAGTVYEQKNK
jgi:hypothetical protein